MPDVFSANLAAWREYTATPWGRIRYAVVEETLRREAAELGQRLRVLDVGGGDGMDALPLARAGHEVTVLDQSEVWLAEARRRAADAGVAVSTVTGDLDGLPELGHYDLVLCHFVLQYRADPAADLRRLAALVRPGGRLSVMVPNPASMVVRQLLLAGPPAARAELVAETKHAATFDHDARKIPMGAMEAMLGDAGLTIARRYGTRIANDLIVDNAPKGDPAFFRDLLDLELALCDREPFVRIGAMYQLVASASPTC